jgi:hypothetical protein
MTDDPRSELKPVILRWRERKHRFGGPSAWFYGALPNAYDPKTMEHEALYGDDLRTRLEAAEAEVARMRLALRLAASAMEAEAVVLETAQLAKSCAAALHRKAAAARASASQGQRT